MEPSMERVWDTLLRMVETNECNRCIAIATKVLEDSKNFDGDRIYINGARFAAEEIIRRLKDVRVSV
jgi:hypothetical protein